MTSRLLKWWLIGYLTGDSHLDRYGLRTSSSDPEIAARLRRLADSRAWIRLPSPKAKSNNRRPLYMFRFKDPEIIRWVIDLREERAYPEEPRAWLGGYLDADGSAFKLKTMIAAELAASSWKIIRLILRICGDLNIKTSLRVLGLNRGKIRRNPVFIVYARPMNRIPAIKIEKIK